MTTPEFIPTQQLLDTPIGNQEHIAPLKLFAVRHGYYTLRELLMHPLSDLLAMDGFSPECYDALIGFLESHQRLYLLRVTNQA